MAQTTYYWYFWVLGLLNNLGYVVVLSSSKSLAANFDAGDEIGAINWVLVALGFAVRMFNLLRLEGRVSFRTRIWWTAVAFAVGTAGLVATVAAAPRAPFALALLSILVLGGACSFGESVLLGYLEAFPTSGVSGWSSGTGMAGVGGSGLYLVLSWAGASDTVVYVTLLPSAVIYTWIFSKVSASAPPGANKGKVPNSAGVAAEPSPIKLTEVDMRHGDADTIAVAAASPRRSASGGASGGGGDGDSTDRDDGADEEAVLLERSADPELPKEHWWRRTKRCFPYVRRYAVNLGLVYFFEYVIQVAGAALANTDDDGSSGASSTTTPAASNESNAKKHAFALLALSYQLGVLVSRSSLSFVAIKRIEIMTFFQAINFVWWAVQARWQLFSLSAQIACMVWVGLMGGAMYVNVFALMVRDDSIPQADREFAINIVAIAINIGIVLASIFDLIAVPLVHSARGD